MIDFPNFIAKCLTWKKHHGILLQTCEREVKLCVRLYQRAAVGEMQQAGTEQWALEGGAKGMMTK